MIDPPPPGEHRAHGVLESQERAREVDVDGAAPHVEVEVAGLRVLAEELHARVRDDDVGDPAVGRELGEGGDDGCLVGDVHGHGARRVAVSLDAACAPAASRSANATRAPSCRNRSATWRPMPDAAPVTSAVFPVSRSVMCWPSTVNRHRYRLTGLPDRVPSRGPFRPSRRHLRLGFGTAARRPRRGLRLAALSASRASLSDPSSRARPPAHRGELGLTRAPRLLPPQLFPGDHQGDPGFRRTDAQHVGFP